jgi:hypothetical protein
VDATGEDSGSGLLVITRAFRDGRPRGRGFAGDFAGNFGRALCVCPVRALSPACWAALSASQSSRSASLTWEAGSQVGAQF